MVSHRSLRGSDNVTENGFLCTVLLRVVFTTIINRELVSTVLKVCLFVVGDQVSTSFSVGFMVQKGP